MIIETLLIFLIDPCALTNTNRDFKYLKELDGSSLRQLSRLTGFSQNKILRT